MAPTLDYLYAAPDGTVAPPARSHAQLLPFSQLTWQNFERLCLRLAEKEALVEHARLYGVAGQAQEGIDLFARRVDGDYWVYQCRRVREFSTGDLEKIATDFLEGEWAQRASRLILYTSADLTDAKLALAVEAQDTRLRASGKTFEALDADGLSRRLKDLPELVLDFFDRAWLEEFCPGAAEALKARLGAADAHQLRTMLAGLYSNVFAQQDAAVLLGLAGEAEREFVVQDISERRELMFAVPPVPDRDHDGPQSVPRREGGERDVEQRIGLQAWLAGGNAHVLCADAGSGKSSTLRYLAVDLLSDAPQLAGSIASWRDRLPVWLPFGFWVRRVEHDESCSLADAMRDWLASYSEERCWPLVQRALDDDRLLLLIDGLDEWIDAHAAVSTFKRLAVFVGQRGAQLLATTRPAALAQLGPLPTGWREGSLAGLSLAQQRELLQPLDSERTDAFLEAVARSPSLRHLARTPLLLVLLFSLFRSQATLPQDRFKAYGESLDYLVREHPRRRANAPAKGPLDDPELTAALAAVAYTMQNTGTLILDTPCAEATVAAHLADPVSGLALNLAEARLRGREVIADSIGRLGILVAAGEGSIAFLHRSFLERLAATHMASMPADEMLKMVGEHGSQASWGEVILNLLSLAGPGERSDQVLAALLEGRTGPQRAAMQPFLAEILACGLGTPTALEELSREVLETIETAPRSTIREQTLTRLLEAGRPGVREEAAIERWLPCVIDGRARVLSEMARWPRDEQVSRTIWRSLFDEDTATCRSAASAYIDLHNDSSRAHDDLLALLDRPTESQTRAAALEAVAKSWPHDPRLARLMASARGASDGNLRAVAHRWRIDRGAQSREDLKDLLALAGQFQDIDYERKPDVFALIMRGWPGDPEVKRIALDAARGQQRPTPIEQDGALWLLLEGYPKDPDVLAYCLEQVEHAKHPFLMSRFDSWKLLAKSFRDEPELVAAIDRWLPKQTYSEVEISYAARVGRTDTAKAAMLDGLANSSNPHWFVRSLLEEWGMADPDVATALVAAARGDGKVAGRIAHEIPEIIGDRQEATTRITELLSDPANPRPDLALMALGELGKLDGPVVGAALARSDQSGRPGDIWWWLIRYAPQDPRVRELAGSYVEKDWYPAAIVAHAYADDTEIRSEICKRMNPLPAQLRTRAAEHIRDGCASQQLAASVSRLFLNETDPLVATTLAQARVRRARDTEPAALEAQVSEAMMALGPSLESTRQTALAAALELGRIELFVNANEPLRQEEPVSIGLTELRRPNVVLAETIAQHWRQLRASVDDLVARLSKWGGPAATWGALALVAEGYPAVAEEALRELNAGTACTASLLRLYARLHPRGPALCEMCLRVLSGELKGESLAEDVQLVAVELLADAYTGDEQVLERVCAANLSEETQLLVLAEGWPDSAQLEEAIARARAEDLIGLPEHIARVRIATDPQTVALGNLRKHIGWLAAAGRYADRALPAIIRRLRRDTALASQLEHELFAGGTPDETASFARLLALAGALAPDGHEGLTALIQDAFTGESAIEVAYDVVAGRHRPLASALLDALQAG